MTRLGHWVSAHVVLVTYVVVFVAVVLVVQVTGVGAPAAKPELGVCVAGAGGR
jgi:hypothetical protein